MAIEVELKFSLSDRAGLERALAELGGQAGQPRIQVDHYFAHPERDFSRTDEALRLRRVEEANYITYKGPRLDPVTKTRREIELALAPGAEAFAQATEMLRLLGFTPLPPVRKSRTPWNLRWQDREIEAAVDEVDGLGAFVELEVVAADDDLEPARQAILSLAERLDLRNSERRSYLELLTAARSEAGSQA